MLFSEFKSQTLEFEKLEIEVLKVSLMDNVDLSETSIKELLVRRPLEKETNLVSILKSEVESEQTADPSGPYPRCSECVQTVQFRQQAKSVREANAEE